MNKNAERLAAFAYAVEHIADRFSVLRRHVMEKLTAGKIFVAPPRRVQRLHRGAIGLDDTQVGGGHDHNGFVGGVENQAIAGLDFAKLPIIPLHGLLSGDQA